MRGMMTRGSRSSAEGKGQSNIVRSTRHIAGDRCAIVRRRELAIIAAITRGTNDCLAIAVIRHDGAVVVDKRVAIDRRQIVPDLVAAGVVVEFELVRARERAVPVQLDRDLRA